MVLFLLRLFKHPASQPTWPSNRFMEIYVNVYFWFSVLLISSESIVRRTPKIAPFVRACVWWTRNIWIFYAKFATQSLVCDISSERKSSASNTFCLNFFENAPIHDDKWHFAIDDDRAKFHRVRLVYELKENCAVKQIFTILSRLKQTIFLGHKRDIFSSIL